MPLNKLLPSLAATLNTSSCLVLGTTEDEGYMSYLKGMFNGVNTYTTLRPFKYLTELEAFCQGADPKTGLPRNITRVATTSTGILGALLSKLGNPRSDPKLSEYAGSFFRYGGLEIVIIPPLKQLVTTSEGKFITSRFISKLVNPSAWQESTQFKWKVLSQENINEFYSLAHSPDCFAMSSDIETIKEGLRITHVSFTLLLIDSDTGDMSTETGVLVLKSPWELEWARKLLSLPVQKIYQNGKYDNIYNLRYGIIPVNWLHDTAYFMHCWYAELPKDLAFQNAFFLREVVYWKDLAETSDQFEYCRYNAMDSWATMNVWVAQMLKAPEWARRNFLQKFPIQYPSLLAELTGLKRNPEAFARERAKVVKREEEELALLRRELGSPNFNPSSPKQVSALLHILMGKDMEGSGEDILLNCIYAHPLNGRILSRIITIRGLRKLRTNYLRTDEDKSKPADKGNKDYKGFILYSINPHGTETGRNSSKESSFWCGLQLQNIPTGPEVKSTIEAPDGFYIGEADLEQAEARDVAYLSGDTALIAAVSGTRDFHSVNAAAFFGIPYEALYDDVKKKTLNKPVRNTAKRTNHGANYNMGAFVLANTMGVKAVWEAKELLKLPFWDPLDVCEYLLVRFHMTYSGIKGMTEVKSREVRQFLGILPTAASQGYKLYAPGTYYSHIANSVAVNSMLVSRAYHHSSNLTLEDNLSRAVEHIEKGDWTRYCFGDPVRNKLDLNSYVAHPSQSLNAITLDKAFMRVFYEIALPEAEDFRLNGQIHDSILFCWREGRTDLPSKVQSLMQIPVTVRDCKGKITTFTVPAALKIGKPYRDIRGSAVVDDFGDEVYRYSKFWDAIES